MVDSQGRSGAGLGYLPLELFEQLRVVIWCVFSEPCSVSEE